MRKVVRLSRAQLEEIYESESLKDASQLFLRNRLAAEIARRTSASPAAAKGSFYGVVSHGQVELAAFAGASRVLVLGPGSHDAGVALRRIAVGRESGFRILIGSAEPTRALLDAIRPRLRAELERSQPFMAVEAVCRLGATPEVRPANSGDLSWLATASLRLNEEDLHIAPRTVDRSMLDRRLQDRISDRRTWIVDVDGRPATKLDVGDRGPAGALIEGVYTVPEMRGRGLARDLVASVSRDLLREFPRVGLHVGRDNVAAVKAYEAAGFHEVEDLLLALVSWGAG